VCTALVTILGLPVVAAIWLATAPFDRGQYAAGRMFRRLAVLAIHLNPLWKFKVTGRGPSDPRRPYVAVSNHESYADIFLISMFPWEMKWLAKTTIFNIPVMGWLMRLAGDIPVIRGERASAIAALASVKERLVSRKVSVMIFPEGTRSRTEEMLPFKDGAFKIAIETGAPILPIAVAGTRYAMRKGSFRFNRAVAMARVLAPIDTAGLTAADLPALKERVRGVIDEARHALRRELGLEGAGDRALVTSS
jgi:1-acyl-sn-glycerol-3-phosphate acyltransferase